MKKILLALLAVFTVVHIASAQTGRKVSGTIIDSAKLSVPSASVKLTSEQGDSSIVAADIDGKFIFPAIKGNKIKLTISSIGFQTLIKRFSFEPGNQPVDLGSIILPLQSNMLGQVDIIGAPNPVQLKEDTVEYKIGAYAVRDNAPIEDALKKMPGIDVDKDGNVTAQGKQVTKVRLNGKDYFGGDLQTATKNLPADIVDNIQIIDDYGDQANLTGVKTGEPEKILNITIRKDKNYGYSLQATAGDGTDALPSDPGTSNANRYLGVVNFFKFKGDQQLSVLGNLNNTNVNTFSFGSPSFGGFGGNFGGGRRGFSRGGGGQTTSANGITNAKSIGVNFRDDWGKKISVYGSYSFNDNTTFTRSSEYQLNRLEVPITRNSTSEETNDPLNHRIDFNVEYKPDTMNYIKISPSFSYSDNNTEAYESVTSARGDSTNLAYNLLSTVNSTSPNFGINTLFNHKFNSHGRNLSLNIRFNSAKNDQYNNPIYDYEIGDPTTPLYQRVNTNSRTNVWRANVSYMEPLSKVSYLELNYTYNRSYTTADKATDTLSYTGNQLPDSFTDADFNRYDLLSNSYNYTFTTNKVGLNYRFVNDKMNYILGIGIQPTTLVGKSINAPQTERKTVNWIPNARLVYKFSRNKSFVIDYDGENSQPSFNQLQPVYDFSNALYPVLGNPNLKPEFVNDFSLRYNNFSFETGNVFFARLQFNQYNDRVVSQTTSYPGRFSDAALAEDPTLENLKNANLTTYTNTDGFYDASAFAVFSKPWSERKYTMFLNGRVSYSNNIGFSRSVDSNNVVINPGLDSDFQKNISKNLVFTPGARFRINITDVIDAEANISYAINRTVSRSENNNNPLMNQNTNARTLNLGINGKNYFWKDWTFSYDFTRSVNYGYSVAVTNPNILNLYVERRFLKKNAATIRLQGFDLFNQNRGFQSNDNGIITTQSNVNRLSRYFLLTFTLRLQQFAGKGPSEDDGPGGFRRRGPGM